MRPLILLVLCFTASAAPWNPPVFQPMTHPDGSQTWLIKILLSDIPKTDRTAADRDTKIASSFLGHHRYCENGWEITSAKEDGKWLTIAGICKR